MLPVILLAILTAYMLIIWLKTDAFAEYMNLVTLGSCTLFHLDDYRKVKEEATEGHDGNYIDFMFQFYKDRFFVRLLSCPICLSTWIGFVGIAVYLPALDGLFLGPLTLLVYLIYVKLM